MSVIDATMTSSSLHPSPVVESANRSENLTHAIEGLKSLQKSSITLANEDKEEKGKERVEMEDEEQEEEEEEREDVDNNSLGEEINLYGLSELATVALEQKRPMQVSNPELNPMLLMTPFF